jgi:class 3 adenylate cyclase
VGAAEKQGRLRIIDSYAVQTELNVPARHEPYGFASRSLRMTDWIAASPQVLDQAGEHRLLHIDENNSVLRNYNTEAEVLNFFRARTYEGARKNESLFIHTFLGDTHSRQFYATFEPLADIVVEFESREEAGSVSQRVRTRRARGRSTDTRWRTIRVLEEGEVGFALEPPESRPFSKPGTPARLERRLAANMFTDVVGFTALAQESEGRAVELLTEHNTLLRQVIKEHDGAEVKTMGDSFPVEFASALAATKCALAIQVALGGGNATHRDRPIRVRIGIHVGDILHQGGDIYSDAVNIASRIESLASSDGVCVSQQVYDQVWNKSDLSFEELGKQDLKRVRLPLAVYRIVR